MAGHPYTYVDHCTLVRFDSIFESKSAEEAHRVSISLKKKLKKLTSCSSDQSHDLEKAQSV